MLRTQSPRRLLGLAGALCALGLPISAHAQSTVNPITVNPTVSALNGGLYHYNYTVTNGSVFDLSLVTISTIATTFSQGAAVQNLVAPTGFTATFDSGLGLLDFAENTQPFTAGTTVSGFAFDSAYAPGASTFEALALPEGGSVTFDGTTLAPAPVPEAGTATGLGLGLGLLLGLIGLGLRRRRSAASANERG